jgi:hypothetical protein
MIQKGNPILKLADARRIIDAAEGHRDWPADEHRRR